MTISLLILFGSTVLLSMARFAWLCVAGVLVLWFLYCLRTDKNIRILLGRLALVVVALVMYVILLVAFGRVAYFFGKSTSILTTNSSALVSNSNAERSSALVSNSNAERIEIIRTTVKVIRKTPLRCWCRKYACLLCSGRIKTETCREYILEFTGRTRIHWDARLYGIGSLPHITLYAKAEKTTAFNV